jgi:hypothetical protein
MAGLKYVVLNRSIYVTTPAHAKVMEEEEKIRGNARKQAFPAIPRLGTRLEPAPQ